MLALINLSPNTSFFFFNDTIVSFWNLKANLVNILSHSTKQSDNILKEKVTVLFPFHTEKVVR